MADESDVETALVDLLDAALYPTGPGDDCAAGPPCKIFAGWPVSAQLEADLAAALTCVSVFTVLSSASDVGQPFLTEDSVLEPAVHGLSAALLGSTITLSGSPTQGEYVTALVGGQGYTYSAVPGDTPEAVAAGLAAELAAAFPGTTATGATVQVATNQDVLVRLGAPQLMGTRIHRQRQQYRITVWAPTPEHRTAVARFVDLALKRNTVIRLPDTTQAIVTYQGTNPSDLHELTGLYRRDLIFNVTYDTLDTYTAFEVTSVGTNLEIRLPV